MKNLYQKLTLGMAFIGVLIVVIAATPNMNLTLPVPGVTPGPTWATQINTALGVNVDQHDHSAGKGVRVGVPGLNIQQDLPLNAFNLSNVRSCRLANQGNTLSQPSDVRNLYSVLGDLYYNNGAGFPVKVTSGTTVNVSGTGGFGGQYASAGALASYLSVGNKYTFLGPVSSAANVEISGNSTVAGTLSVTGITSSGSPLSVSGSPSSLNIYDTLGGTTDFQWQVADNQINLNADTNNDNLFDRTGIIYASPTQVSVLGAPNSTAPFTVAGNSMSIQFGTNATASANFHYSTDGAGSFNLYNGNNGAGSLIQQMLSPGEMGIGGAASSGVGLFVHPSNPNDTYGIISRVSHNNGAGFKGFVSQTSNGTPTAPTATNNGDLFSGITMGGYDGTSFVEGATVVASSSQNWSVGNTGTELDFYTTPLNTSGTVVQMSVQPNGYLLPASDGVQNIGNPGYRWGIIYGSDAQLNTAHVGSIQIDAGTIAATSEYDYVSPQQTTWYFSPAGGVCDRGQASHNFCFAGPNAGGSTFDGSMTIASNGSGVGGQVCMFVPLPLPYDPNITTSINGGFVRMNNSTANTTLIITLLKKDQTSFPRQPLAGVLSFSTTKTGTGNTTMLFNNGVAYSSPISDATYYASLCCQSTDLGICHVATIALNVVSDGVPRGMVH